MDFTRGAHTHNGRPPRFPLEGPLQDRNSENDAEALRIANMAYEIKKSKRMTKSKMEAGLKLEQTASLDENNGDETLPLTNLPLRSLYDGFGSWPLEGKDRALQPSWGGIGYPEDTSLVVENFEHLTHIDRNRDSVKQLANDVLAAVYKASSEIPVGGAVDQRTKHKRTIEVFKLHGRSVTKVQIHDADVFKKAPVYSRCAISKATEAEIDKNLQGQRTHHEPPSLDVER